MTSPRQAAASVMDNVPLLMRLLRTKFRETRVDDLTMAQFRTLAFVDANPDASLSDAAGHIGLSLPSMSKLVDALVKHELLARGAHCSDRRRICLSITASGKRELDKAYLHTQSFFARRFADLTESERNQVESSMKMLKKLFALNAKKSPVKSPEK